MKVSALDALNALVTQAESTRKAGRLVPQFKEAAEKLCAAARRFSKANTARIDQAGKAQVRLSDANARAVKLEELKKRAAMFQKEMIDKGTWKTAQQQVEQAESAINQERRESQDILTTLYDEYRQADTEQQEAAIRFENLKAELDRLQLTVDLDNPQEVASALQQAKDATPEGQLRTLRKEAQDHASFARLTRAQQHALLRMMIGRYRLLQDYFNSLPEDDRDSYDTNNLAATFTALKELSNKFRPGHCDAFQIAYRTEWQAYIDEAREDLMEAYAADTAEDS